MWTAINPQKKRYNQSVNMKRYSISLILIEIQIKAPLRYHYAFICMAKPKYLTILTAGNNAEK